MENKVHAKSWRARRPSKTNLKISVVLYIVLLLPKIKGHLVEHFASKFINHWNHVNPLCEIQQCDTGKLNKLPWFL